MNAPRRSRGREIALQALYRVDLNPATTSDELDAFLRGRLGHPVLVAFARQLIDGVRDHRADIDALLDSRADHWRVARMPATDRAILRLAAYELLHGDVPDAVAADEAIELAKRYGTDASARFVAGLMGRLVADRRAASASTS